MGINFKETSINNMDKKKYDENFNQIDWGGNKNSNIEPFVASGVVKDKCVVCDSYEMVEVCKIELEELKKASSDWMQCYQDRCEGAYTEVTHLKNAERDIENLKEQIKRRDELIAEVRRKDKFHSEICKSPKTTGLKYCSCGLDEWIEKTNYIDEQANDVSM